jgi:hypothetical protein
MAKKFNAYEEKIIKCLHQYGRPMTMNEIVVKTKIGWATVKHYIEKLEGDVVEKEEIDEQEYWYLNY